MDPFDFLDSEMNSKNSNFPCGFREIKKLFRILEISLILICMTWVATRLPFAVRISGEYCRYLLNVVVSPLFVFLLCNALVLTLFFKSRHLLLSDLGNSGQAHLDFCREFIDTSGDCTNRTVENGQSGPQEIVFQDKQTIFEVTKVVKVHRRSLSENFGEERCVERNQDSKCGSCELRRSESEGPRRAAAETVDKLSNEDFQRTIEAFIEKQIKFHQEEKLAIVLQGCTA